MSSIALNTPKLSVVIVVLSAIVATETTFASAGFWIAPSSTVRQHADHRRHFAETHRRFGRGIRETNFHLPQKGQQTSTAIRGGGGNDEQLKDCNGAVAGLFGNLRIPASLIAGASLGSAFALPFLDTDGAKIGMAKRLYAFSMVTTLGSMLLVIIVSTISMNDITIRPTRLSKSVGDYINENYSLEWMIVRSHFFYGAFAFLGGSAFRAYISIACPVIGKGVIGILTSLSLICMSYLFETTHSQLEQPFHKRCARLLKAIGAKSKANILFGAGAITWVTAVTYLIYKTPHMITYLSMM